MKSSSAPIFFGLNLFLKGLMFQNLLSKERSFTKKVLFLLRKKSGGSSPKNLFFVSKIACLWIKPFSVLLKAGKVSETPKGVSDCFHPCFRRPLLQHRVMTSPDGINWTFQSLFW